MTQNQSLTPPVSPKALALRPDVTILPRDAAPLPLTAAAGRYRPGEKGVAARSGRYCGDRESPTSDVSALSLALLPPAVSRAGSQTRRRWSRTHDTTAGGGRRAVGGGQWAADGRRWTADGGQRTAGGGWRAADGRRRTLDGRRWTADGGRRTVDSGRRAVDGGRWTADSGQRTADGGRRTAGGGRQAAGTGHTVSGG